MFEDEEIIVGIDIKDNSNKKNSKNKKKKSSKNTNSKKNNGKKTNKRDKKDKESNKAKGKLGKIICFIILIIIVFIIILSSSLFNLREIDIIGNDKISKDTIISLSGIQIHQNIFKFNKSAVIEKIKENAYVENVKISRKLPSKLEITIRERVPRYMLELAGSYAYINNQGYILEITPEKLQIPILTGIVTDLANIKPGDRMNIEDLKKMDTVIKIYETAKSNEISDLITKIDIQNDKNYTLILEPEGKTVYLGECSDLNTRILYLKVILEKNRGKAGEVFLDIDLNSDNGYFRPSSN